MYGTKSAFNYINVGGRCSYETNKAFEFPAQPFYSSSSLYTTEHDDILCEFIDTSSYVEILFDTMIPSDKYYMLRLVYYVKNVNNLNLNITWKKEGDISFCANCYEHVSLEVSPNNFLHADVDLRQNSEWVGNITNLRIGTYNTEIVPLFIRYLSVYSPTTYKCSKPSCLYYSKYSTPCGAGKDLHTLIGDVFEENSISLLSNSDFSFEVYGISFVVNILSNTYFIDNVLDEINTFFSTVPVPGLLITLDDNRIHFICNYIKPIIKYTELSEKLGFFNNQQKETYTYVIENTGDSDYIDIAGNLKGLYKLNNLNDLNFSKVFSVGFKSDGDMYPASSFEFDNKTVIFHDIVIQFDGYINCFEVYCKALLTTGKILIFRRDGNTYKVVYSYTIQPIDDMKTYVIDWPCNVYKGDVIGIYNLKIGMSKQTTNPISHYGIVDGYSDYIEEESIENVSFSAVSFYAYFKPPTSNDIPIEAVYNEISYVDKVSFLLEQDVSVSSYFNIMFNNIFNTEIKGCDIFVKDDLDVVTTVSGEITNVECLSDNVFYNDSIDFDIDIFTVIPPVVLNEMENRSILKYSWSNIILGMYENSEYTITFLPGEVFFYYEFPALIDICKVNIYSEDNDFVDKSLLKVLDNTEACPSFSNLNDIVVLDVLFKGWEFIIDECVTTKGVGILIYNFSELPKLNLSEIEIYTHIGNVPRYIINVAATIDGDIIVPFELNTVGVKSDVYIGNHIKKLTLNVGFISDEMGFDFRDINIYSSYVPNDYFVSADSSGEGVFRIYNTRSKKLKCYLLDYNTNLLNNLVYDYDFDNGIIHRGFVPTRYTHEKFYFVSSNYLNNTYITYALKNLINIEEFFVTKEYSFKNQEYDDWFVPYDYLVPGYDGRFVYIDGGLKLKPSVSEAMRWFNYININEFYNDIDIELMFDYIGNISDFVFIGLTCCDREYNNYLKFYCAFQFSSEYGLEFQLNGDTDPTYYKISAHLGRSAGLRIKKRGNVWTFSCFYSDEWHELTSFTLFDTEIIISISTLFNASAIEGNVIAEFNSCNINASKIIYGKKVWYTINDGLSYVYSGHVLDNSTIIENISGDFGEVKELSFTRENTIEKFVYDFGLLSVRYLKFTNTKYKDIKITEIKCYLNDELVEFEQGMVSYSDDLFFGTLTGNTDNLDDNVIINRDLSESLYKGGDDVLSTVGVVFNKNTGINKAVVYYVKETGTYEPLRVTYSYDNAFYYDVYDNFSLFSSNYDTALYCLFNEFSGYKGYNEILYKFSSNNQYSTYFSTEGVLDHKWLISSPYAVDSGGVWLKHLQGVESLYSKFSIDDDLIVDVYFDSSSALEGSSRVVLKLVFKNNTYYEYVYVKQDFIDNRVYNSRPGTSHSVSIEDDRTSGGLRIKRIGSVFYFYYRKYGTTWVEVDNYNYGSAYIYPVDVNVYLTGTYSFDLRIEKVIITEGTGIADTDFTLLESPSVNSLFVRGRQFSTSDTYAVAENWDMTELSYPFSLSLAHCVNSSISAENFLVSKPYSFGLTYEGDDLSLWWFSEYFIKLKIEDVLSYSTSVNSIISMSVDSYETDETLFTKQSDLKIKAIYKPKYNVTTFIDESFKEGDGTFYNEYVDAGCNAGYLFDSFTASSGTKADVMLWNTYNTLTRGRSIIVDNSLYVSFNDSVVCNPNDKNSHISLSDGYLTATITSTGDSGRSLRCTEAMSSGKWYWEIYMVNIDGGNCHVGIATKEASLIIVLGYDVYSWSYRQHGDLFHLGGDHPNWDIDFFTGDVIGIALDMDAGKLWFSKNGTWLDSGDPVAGTGAPFTGITGEIYPAIGLGYTPASERLRFDSSDWSYSPPSGFGELQEFFAEYTSVKMVYSVGGDFDVQTTFSGLQGADSNRAGIGIRLEIDDDNRVYLKAGYDSEEVFMCGITVIGEITGYNSQRTNDHGQLRIVRNNDTVTTYYKDGNTGDWTLFSYFSSFPITAGVISLGLYSSTSRELSGYFNDFVLTTTSGDVTCQPSQLEDDFTGVNGSSANSDDWTTHDTSRGTVRIQDNSLNFSFVK